MAEVTAHIENTLATLNQLLGEKKDTKESLKALKTLKQDLKQWHTKVKADFKQFAADLKAKKLPQVILDRQAEAEARYQQQVTDLLNQLAIIETTKDDATRKLQVKKAHTQLKHHQKKKSQVPFDPDAMGHGSFKKAPKNKPKLKKTDFKAAGLLGEKTGRRD
jgi:predicted nuclease with TOPRIM domain